MRRERSFEASRRMFAVRVTAVQRGGTLEPRHAKPSLVSTNLWHPVPFLHRLLQNSNGNTCLTSLQRIASISIAAFTTIRVHHMVLILTQHRCICQQCAHALLWQLATSTPGYRFWCFGLLARRKQSLFIIPPDCACKNASTKVLMLSSLWEGPEY